MRNKMILERECDLLQIPLSPQDVVNDAIECRQLLLIRKVKRDILKTNKQWYEQWYK